MKTREEYLSTLSVGNIVAFKSNEDTITIKTKNGSVFYRNRFDIVWIKNGSRWPIGIFNALKATKNRKT